MNDGRGANRALYLCEELEFGAEPLSALWPTAPQAAQNRLPLTREVAQIGSSESICDSGRDKTTAFEGLNPIIDVLNVLSPSQIAHDGQFDSPLVRGGLGRPEAAVAPRWGDNSNSQQYEKLKIENRMRYFHASGFCKFRLLNARNTSMLVRSRVMGQMET